MNGNIMDNLRYHIVMLPFVVAILLWIAMIEAYSHPFAVPECFEDAVKKAIFALVCKEKKI